MKGRIEKEEVLEAFYEKLVAESSEEGEEAWLWCLGSAEDVFFHQFRSELLVGSIAEVMWEKLKIPTSFSVYPVYQDGEMYAGSILYTIEKPRILLLHYDLEDHHFYTQEDVEKVIEQMCKEVNENLKAI
jgi:trehalose utilization protein